MSWQDPAQEPPSLPSPDRSRVYPTSALDEGSKSATADFDCGRGKEAGLPARPAWQSIRRGLFGRCPNCDRGRMFRAFLKVADHCPVCGEALHHHRADDAPSYFDILIVGHVVVPLALVVEVAYTPPYWLHAVLWLPLTIGLAVGLLQPIKGAIVGWQWASYMHGFDPNSADEETTARESPPPLAGEG